MASAVARKPTGSRTVPTASSSNLSELHFTYGNDVIDLTKVKPEAPPAEPSPSIAASRPKRAAARKK